MARHYATPEAQCPFYRMEETHVIHCEGVVPDSTIRLYLRKAPAQYREQYCRGTWAKCPIAKMLWSLYDDPKNLCGMKHAEPFQVRGEQI